MKIAVPQIDPLTNILPEEPLLMMGAGPVPIPQAVANANSIVINHLGKSMKKVVHQIKSMGGYIFQTDTPWIVGVAGPGSAAMEMAVANLVWKDTSVLSICNGFFSSRLAQMAERSGGIVKKVDVGEKNSVVAQDIRDQVEKLRPTVITLVQGETSNTTYNHQLVEIGKIAKEFNCYLIVDAVCTLSTMPLKMDEWNIDAVITGGQKGLSSIPGVSLVAFSERAWDRLNSRSDQIPQWTLDAKLASNFWHKNSYHYTAPVSGLLALHEAMRLICEETLPVRFRRHLTCSKALQNAITTLGLELYIQEENRLNSVIGISLPTNMDSKTVCEHISNKYRVEIAGSFGSPIVRIGQMGEQCRVHNLFRTIHAFGSTFNDLSFKLDVPAGMAELENSLQRINL
ncbi:MAG: alanine--glyoxylate aminotransferase family protein [Alteromonadaceae bacterium]|nr:alanine--glyoxylate aminotransferase family protein [Alteromonadaceae bacterium]